MSTQNPPKTSPKLDPWMGVTPVYLGNPSKDSVTSEPSGLTIYSDGTDKWIFMVSDNGIVAKAKLPASTPTQELDLKWQINATPNKSDKAYDYESVTFAKGNVMIGVEGDRKDGNVMTSPVVKRFDQNQTSSSNPAGNLTTSSWTLNGIAFGSVQNSGMEALTLIPSGSYPSNWTKTAPYYGGVFFAAVQAVFGKVYVYDLAQGSGQSHDASPLDLGTTSNPLDVPNPATDGSQPLISDMFFDASSSALYALYDGDVSKKDYKDYLQKLTVSTSSSATTANTLHQVWGQSLPWLDCEGVAVNGSDLYISIDSSSHSENDGVFVLKGVLSKLS